MSIEFEVGMLCDLTRYEFSRKLIVIGAYSTEVVLGSFPNIVQFHLVAYAKLSGSGLQDFAIRVKQGDDVIFEMAGQINVPKDVKTWIPIELQPMQFLVPTTLSVEQKAGDDWREFFFIGVVRGTVPTVSQPPS